ncbi:fatty-acid amide hydrolase 2-like [Tropilaelaps mercedesae]|uniref:Fatty-acid amide hydrolase 2-like n=1 Tax=Tropilaelaps mercedesae TaxID=418985 RepID=A0A1V9X0N1_9ACAR|nr:fatty-acid amide hydrolase 2-like [Tropilaelaps mercedesae]
MQSRYNLGVICGCFDINMASWAITLLSILSEVVSLLLIRAYETTKYVFHQGFRDGRRKIPPLRKAFLSYPATRLAKMLRKRQLSSEELVNAIIARILEVEPFLNAVVEDRFKAALYEARQADKELALCKDTKKLARSRPFLGVPFTVTNSIGVKGLLIETGNEARYGVRSRNDAILVSRMIAAGGIILAVTNVSESCFWVECSNHLYGRTNNPYDLHRTPGGSSGGESALVSACASTLGVGWDISGSIRLPSAWCGLFGHKPSPGFVSNDGTFPDKHRALRSQIVVAGPIARTAEDCIATMRVIADDPSTLRLDEPVDVGNLRVFFCDHEGATWVSSVQPKMRKQVRRVVDFLKNDFGVKVQPFPEAEKLAECQEWWFNYLAAEDPDFQLSFDGPDNLSGPIIELVKHASGFSLHDSHSVAFNLLYELYRLDLGKCRKSYRAFERFKHCLRDLLQDNGVLILPSTTSIAPFHHGTLCNPLRYLRLAGLINVLQLPATIVPMGLDYRGLPLSVQRRQAERHNEETLSAGATRTIALVIGRVCDRNDIMRGSSTLARLLYLLSELLSLLSVRTYETVKFFFHQGFRDGRKKLPALRTPFLSYSATKLAQMIRNKELTSERLVLAVIARIREVEPLLNAVVEDRFEAALSDARKADMELAACEDIVKLAKEKPFLGIPFTVKDCICIKGMLAEVGNLSRRGFRAKEDAECVIRLIAAGGIPLAITNVAEMCLWIESTNHLHGRTNNPYDIHRTSGGSTGGESALLSACASVWGVGTDISGSIRLPSAWCGIFGHKPSPGLIACKGVVPETNLDLKFTLNVLGPMARTSEDCIEMMKIMADSPSTLGLDDPVDIGALKYFFCDHEGASYVSSIQPEVRKQVHRVVEFLKNDFNVQAKPLPEQQKMARRQEWFFSYLAAHKFPPLKLDFAQPGTTWEPTTELVKLLSGHSSRTNIAIAVNLLDEFYRRDPEKCQTSYREFEAYKRRMYDLIRNDGIIILPASASVAPFHHGTLCSPTLYFGMGGLINILGLPSTIVPMGLDSRGLPLSVQIVGPQNQDRLTLAVARELERKFGGFVPPCKIIE